MGGGGICSAVFESKFSAGVLLAGRYLVVGKSVSVGCRLFGRNIECFSVTE